MSPAKVPAADVRVGYHVSLTRLGQFHQATAVRLVGAFGHTRVEIDRAGAPRPLRVAQDREVWVQR